MRKYLIGFIVGAILMFAGQSLAATTSLVGKKIDGQVPITIGGKTIDSAITVQGKSYAPVRNLTTALGGEVKSATKEGIELTTGIDLSNVEDKSYKLTVLNNAKAPLVAERDQYVTAQADLENQVTIADQDVSYAEKNNPDGYPSYVKRLDDAKAAVQANKDKIAELQAQIDAIDQQIAEVNAEPDPTPSTDPTETPDPTSTPSPEPTETPAQ